MTRLPYASVKMGLIPAESWTEVAHATIEENVAVQENLNSYEKTLISNRGGELLFRPPLRVSVLTPSNFDMRVAGRTYRH